MGIRILLVDDHELVRRGIAELLDGEDGLEVVGEAASVAEALECAERVDADVAVLDVRMPDGSGIDLCRELRARLPGLRCLMLTSDDRSRGGREDRRARRVRAQAGARPRARRRRAHDRRGRLLLDGAGARDR